MIEIISVSAAERDFSRLGINNSTKPTIKGKNISIRRTLSNL
jgi:hypothetical protein